MIAAIIVCGCVKAWKMEEVEVDAGSCFSDSVAEVTFDAAESIACPCARQSASLRPCHPLSTWTTSSTMALRG